MTDKKFRKLLVRASNFTNIGIEDRDGVWYNDVAYNQLLTEEEMGIYDTIFNSTDWHAVTNVDMLPRTNGFISIEKHTNKFGIRSEKDEYQYDLALLDCWILKELNSRL